MDVIALKCVDIVRWAARIALTQHSAAIFTGYVKYWKHQWLLAVQLPQPSVLTALM